MNDKLSERVSSRKFIAFAFVMIVSSLCLLAGWADFDQWSDIIKWDMGFYFSANIANHVMTNFGGTSNPPIKQTDEK